MNPTLKKLLLGFFVALATSLGCLSSAHAVIYKGSWDPDFGSTTIFPYLGWRGSAEFILPAACIGITGDCTDPGMQIQNAIVEFYDNQDTSKATVQTLQFGSDLQPLGMSVVTIDGITYLTGAGTDFFAPVAGTATVAKYPYPNGANYFFHLTFAQDLAYLVYTDQGTDSPVCASLHPIPVECGISQVDARITFRQIPEPATAALALIALTGLLGIRRQRR